MQSGRVEESESQDQVLVQAPVGDWPGPKAALLGAPRMEWPRL